MSAINEHLTIAVNVAEPYIHLDNRALIVSNGLITAIFQGAVLRWVDETFTILRGEGRATRRQSASNILGGFVQDGQVTVIAGPSDRLVSVTMSDEQFEHLREAIADRLREGVQAV